MKKLGLVSLVVVSIFLVGCLSPKLSLVLPAEIEITQGQEEFIWI